MRKKVVMFQVVTPLNYEPDLDDTADIMEKIGYLQDVLSKLKDNPADALQMDCWLVEIDVCK